MICKGCQQTMERGTALTWPDGRPRGEFCDDCRDWIGKGHRSSPVVFIASDRGIEGEIYTVTRIYRDDTTGKRYELERSPGLSWAKTERELIKRLLKEAS